MQNATIEERVTLLEIQVVVIQDDVTTLDEDVTAFEAYLTELDESVDFLFDDQVIQDERIFTLEQTSIEITADVEGHFNFILLAILFLS